MRRCFGLDVHRDFAEVAIWQDGIVRSAGRIETTPEALRLFAGSLCEQDEVALEATCNTHAIARLLERHAGRVVVSNPQKTRAIAEAKVKTDKVDARVLAQLLAVGFLPSVWLADDETHALRRQVARRSHIVRQRTRLKNRVQAILHRNLVPRCPAADLFGHKGDTWVNGTGGGGGSSGLSSRALPVRAAAVAARSALLSMASTQLGVPVASLAVDKGVVSGGGKSVKYGDLMGGKLFKIAMNPATIQPGVAPAKPVTAYKVVGTSPPRVDLPDKVLGHYTYVHNIRLPGMLHARVVRPHGQGAVSS